jgi:hypothetical protein
MEGSSLQEVFALTPAVCARYLNHVRGLLLNFLRSMPLARIAWPNTNELEDFSSLIKSRHPLLHGAFGFVDGLHLPINAAEEFNLQNAYYNGWCSSHFTSNIFAFSPDGTIIHATINAPGSWHDSRVARGLFQQLATRTEDGYYLIADTVFPHQGAMKSKIVTPPKDGQYLQGDISPEFFRELLSARQAAEWGMRSIQYGFARLKMPMPASESSYRHDMLELCCRLHQVRVRSVGISQIKSVYMDAWDEYSGGDWGDRDLTRQIQGMLLPNTQKNDRISRYYHIVL